MDLEHVLHRSHRMALIVGVVLSAIAVTIAAFIGRGTLALTGSILLPEPTDITVIAVTEPALREEPGVTITGITFLRKDTAVDGAKPHYDYLVERSDGKRMLVRLGWDTSAGRWVLLTREALHGSIAPEAPEQERGPSP